MTKKYIREVEYSKLMKMLIILPYIITPFLYYNILTENKIPVIIGIFWWTFSPFILFIEFINHSLTFTF